MYTDLSGCSPTPWWNWLISGLQIVVGGILVATGVGAGFGAMLLAGGVMGMISNVLGSTIGGGIGSMLNGWGAISTGISLLSFGVPGIIAGIGLMAVGGAISGAIFGAGFSIASQGIAGGYGNVDWGKVGVDTLIGAGTGALMGAAFAAGGRALGMLGKTGWAQRSVDFGKPNNFLFGSKSGNFTFLRHGTKFRIEASIQHGIHMHYQTIKNGLIIVGSSVPRTMLINTIWNSIVGITSSSIWQFA